MSLRERHWRIFHHAPRSPDVLVQGLWSATLTGQPGPSTFLASQIQIQALPDPRKTDNPDLPRVLVIGDSISMNYHDAAKKYLDGVANYHRNEGNASSSQHGIHHTELWLGNYEDPGLHWDIIQFNHGLHDLKQNYNAQTDRFGDYTIPLADYQANLEKIITLLKKTNATLIWASTTPVPNDNKSRYARRAGAAKEFNEAALEVIKNHPEILINDLFETVTSSNTFDPWRLQNDVHFYHDDQRAALGQAVANSVKKALEARNKN